jgi:hypothetical protein
MWPDNLKLGVLHWVNCFPIQTQCGHQVCIRKWLTQWWAPKFKLDGHIWCQLGCGHPSHPCWQCQHLKEFNVWTMTWNSSSFKTWMTCQVIEVYVDFFLLWIFWWSSDIQKILVRDSDRDILVKISHQVILVTR